MAEEPPGWVLPLLIALMIGFWVLGTVATALTPALLSHHPLALVALEPRNRNLLLASARTDAVPFFVLAVLRRLSSDPLYFALGYLYGNAALRWLEQRTGKSGRRFIGWIERIFPRFSRPLVFLFPGLLVCLLAGVTRMRVRTFVVWNIAGTIFMVTALRLFAGQLSDPLDAINRWNDAYATKLTIATAAVCLLYLVWQHRQGGSDLQSFRDLRMQLQSDAETGEEGGQPLHAPGDG